jgi:sugar phosphate isomerase/epimerase
MRLAFYTYSYTDRQNMSVPDCLARIAGAGYSGVDESGTFGDSIDPRSVTPDRRELVRAQAAKHGLSVEAVVTHAELTRSLAGGSPLDLKGTIDLAVALGASVVTFHMGGGVKDLEPEILWRKVCRWLTEAADYGASQHVSLAVDGIWPTWIVDTPDALARLFDDVRHPGLGVNFDPSYLTLIGVDPSTFARRFAERIVHAHLKDHVGRYPKWEHRIPGQGEMNYEPVFAALEAVDFQGSAAVECFVGMDFAAACDDGFAAMSQAMTPK